jgi:hypothetical protein
LPAKPASIKLNGKACPVIVLQNDGHNNIPEQTAIWKESTSTLSFNMTFTGTRQTVEIE